MGQSQSRFFLLLSFSMELARESTPLILLQLSQPRAIPSWCFKALMLSIQDTLGIVKSELFSSLQNSQLILEKAES